MGETLTTLVIAHAGTCLAARALQIAVARTGCCCEGVLHGFAQSFEVDWLANEVVGAELDRSLYVIELRIGGDHDDGAGIPVLLQLVENFDSGEIGQAHVEQNEIGRFALGEAEGRFAGIGLDDGVAPLFAFLAQGPAHQALVVHDHHFLCRHHRRSHFERKFGVVAWIGDLCSDCIEVIPDTTLKILKGLLCCEECD